MTSKLGVKYSHQSGFSVDKLELDDGKYVIETSLTGVAPGLKLEFKGTHGALNKDKKPNDKSNLSAIYKTDQATLTGGVDLATYETINFSGASSFSNISAGASATLALSKLSLADYSLGVGYSVPKKLFVAVKTEKLSKFKFGLTYEAAKAITVGGTFDFPEKVLTVGGLYKCNPDTTIKTKINSFGVLNASVKQALENGASVTGAAAFDFNKSATGPSFGVIASLG